MYADVISWLLAEFDRCFQKFNNLKPQSALFAPLFDVDAESVSELFQMEVWRAEAEVHGRLLSFVLITAFCRL